MTKDLNILYFSGGGGFLFCHLLLLGEQHFAHIDYPHAYDQSGPWVMQLAQDPEFCQWILDQGRLPESDYQGLKQPSWPSYSDYVAQGNQWPEVQQALLYAVAQNNNDIADIAELNYRKFRVFFQHVMQSQWDPGRRYWKQTEYWPRNDTTRTTPVPPGVGKIYLHGHKLNDWLESPHPGTKVLLYTDVHSHLRLASYKNAWFYNDLDGRTWKPTRINGHRWVLRNWTGHMPDGQPVFDQAATAEKHADIVIKLQDLVNHPEATLSKFGMSFNHSQQKLLAHWRSQHPVELLDRLGIRPNN